MRRNLVSSFYKAHDSFVDAVSLHPKRALLAALVIGLVFGLMGCRAVQAQIKTPAAQAKQVVHLLKNELLQASCSAVVLAPGKAVTAGHCAATASTGVIVFDDSRTFAVTAVVPIEGKDQAILTVPGLPCPCAVLTLKAPMEEEPILLVGYPHGLSKVLTRGEVQPPSIHEGPDVIIVTAGVVQGVSGGGVFVVRDGIAELFGIASKAGANYIVLVSVLKQEEM